MPLIACSQSRHKLEPPFEEDIWQYDPAPPGLPHPSAAPLTPADIFGHPASPPGAPLRMPPGPLICTRRSTLPPRPSRVGQTRRKPGSLQPPSGLTQTHARQAGSPHARMWYAMHAHDMHHADPTPRTPTSPPAPPSGTKARSRRQPAAHRSRPRAASGNRPRPLGQPTAWVPPPPHPYPCPPAIASARAVCRRCLSFDRCRPPEPAPVGSRTPSRRSSRSCSRHPRANAMPISRASFRSCSRLNRSRIASKLRSIC